MFNILEIFWLVLLMILMRSKNYIKLNWLGLSLNFMVNCINIWGFYLIHTEQYVDMIYKEDISETDKQIRSSLDHGLTIFLLQRMVYLSAEVIGFFIYLYVKKCKLFKNNQETTKLNVFYGPQTFYEFLKDKSCTYTPSKDRDSSCSICLDNFESNKDMPIVRFDCRNDHSNLK